MVGSGEYERVSGTNIGGGTFWGLCRLLTGVTNFDEMLELSSRGDSANVDMLVGDIYGRDYGTIGLSADTIASSFGKVVSGDKQLSDYNPAGAHRCDQMRSAQPSKSCIAAMSTVRHTWLVRKASVVRTALKRTE